MTKLLADLFEIMANVRVTIPTKHDIRVVKTNTSPDTLYRLKKLFESALMLTCFFFTLYMRNIYIYDFPTYPFRLCVYTYIYGIYHKHLFTYVLICIYLYKEVYVHPCKYTHMHIRIYIYIEIHTHIPQKKCLAYPTVYL